MANKTPTEFLTPKSLENLSIAGICVWIGCITISGFIPFANSYWIRIMAMSLSVLWALSLFIKRSEFKSFPNYVLFIMNAFLIYAHAAGMNTVTRQSPFEGVGVNANLDSLKKGTVKTAGVFALNNQVNWYPDYKMISYIDTLKVKLNKVSEQKASLMNEFAYVKDRIYSVTKDTLTANQVKSFLRDFGKYVDDTTSFPIMKAEYCRIIDSIKSELEFREKHPITRTISYSYTVNNREMNSQQYIDLLRKEKAKHIDLIFFLANHSKLSSSEIDSLLQKNGFK